MKAKIQNRILDICVDIPMQHPNGKLAARRLGGVTAEICLEIDPKEWTDPNYFRLTASYFYDYEKAKKKIVNVLIECGIEWEEIIYNGFNK